MNPDFGFSSYSDNTEVVTAQLTMHLRFKGGRLQQQSIVTTRTGLRTKSEVVWNDVQTAGDEPKSFVTEAADLTPDKEPKCFTQPDPTFKNEVLNDVDA